MAEAQAAETQPVESGAGFIVLRIAWRNLWRNRRRTWLTAGAIAFAGFLVSFSMSFQYGMYDEVFRSASSFFVGQIEITHRDYGEQKKLEQTLSSGSELLSSLDDFGLPVAPRVQSFALASMGERSYGALVTGVDFEAERRTVNLFTSAIEGELPTEPDDALVGAGLARNLGAGIGDEIVILGTAKEGGVAALALTITGLISSGQPEMDRTMLFARLATVQNGFALGDDLHSIALRVEDLDAVERLTERINATLAAPARARPWTAALPDIVEGIELDRIGGRLMYSIILVLVTFGTVNTFLMIVFERTREFGMLMAIGMQRSQILLQLLLEAGLLWLLGTLIGTVLTVLIIGWLAQTGLFIGDVGGEMSQAFFIGDRIYPALSVGALSAAPLVLLVGTQLAALIAGFRLRRLQPVAALRQT